MNRINYIKEPLSVPQSKITQISNSPNKFGNIVSYPENAVINRNAYNSNYDSNNNNVYIDTTKVDEYQSYLKFIEEKQKKNNFNSNTHNISDDTLPQETEAKGKYRIQSSILNK
jgi:hypothetical protein